MKIAIATGTRADWGLLSPIARGLAATEGIAVSVIATNMHLLPRFGNTIDEIRGDGFEPAALVPMSDGDSPLERAEAMAQCLSGTAQSLSRLKPDCLMLLGDRYEMLAVASAATMLGVPVIHLHGGEITLGAIDDNIRHAISQLASLHFTATEAARQRVIAMGKDPATVINSGSIGVWQFCNHQAMSKADLEASLGFALDRPTLLATFHPATLDPVDPAMRCHAMLETLDTFPDHKIILTYPNNDPRSEGIITEIKAYAARQPERVLLIPSLGLRRYQSALHYVEAVVGNSSSGILEVPSAGIPTVNIGIRQDGRERAPSVIDCGNSSDDIREAISMALSLDFRHHAAKASNPYHKPDTLRIIVDGVIKREFTDTAHLVNSKF